jgi:hypothetical protein
VPEDPEERRAAYDLAVDHSVALERQRYWAPALFVAMALLAAGVALTGATWVWVTVPLWLAGAAGHPYLRAQARRQVELLRPATPPG